MTTFAVSITEAGAIADTVNALLASNFSLKGGRYGLTATAASWPSGTLKLQRLAGDGVTYVDAASFTSAGYQSVQIPPGTYKVTSTVGASLPYLDIVRQPAH